LKRYVINTIGVILMVVAIAFLIKRVIDLGINASLFASPHIVLIIMGLSLIHILSLLLLAYAWRLILSCFVESPVNTVKATIVYLKSNIAKYLPGNVGQYVGRQIFGIALGMSQMQIAFSSVFEIGLLLIGVIIIALVFGGSRIIRAFNTFRIYGGSVIIVMASTLLLLAVLLFFFVKKKPNTFMWIKAFIKNKYNWTQMIIVLLLYITQFSILGIVFILLIKIKMQLSISEISVFLAASAISWIIGFIAPGVPGGIGIRESTLLLTLSIYPQDIILFAAIIQRMIIILGDILAWAVCVLFLERSWKKRDNESS